MKRRAVLIPALCLLTLGCATAATAATAAAPVALSRSLPVSVQSDAAMRAAGDEGPSSSILMPASCTITATKATARGAYRGGFAPAVYGRYGDVIDLYVFSRSGIQLADEPFTRNAPFIGGSGRWTVTVPLNRSLLTSGQPARCMVAAQPTMDFQGAP